MKQNSFLLQEHLSQYYPSIGYPELFQKSPIRNPLSSKNPNTDHPSEKEMQLFLEVLLHGHTEMARVFQNNPIDTTDLEAISSIKEIDEKNVKVEGIIQQTQQALVSWWGEVQQSLQTHNTQRDTISSKIKTRVITAVKSEELPNIELTLQKISQNELLSFFQAMTLDQKSFESGYKTFFLGLQNPTKLSTLEQANNSYKAGIAIAQKLLFIMMYSQQEEVLSTLNPFEKSRMNLREIKAWIERKAQTIATFVENTEGSHPFVNQLYSISFDFNKLFTATRNRLSTNSTDTLINNHTKKIGIIPQYNTQNEKNSFQAGMKDFLLGKNQQNDHNPHSLGYNFAKCLSTHCHVLLIDLVSLETNAMFKKLQVCIKDKNVIG